MAIKMCKGTLAFMEDLRQRGGQAMMALDTRIVMAEVVDGNVEISPTDQHPNGWKGKIDFKLGDKVETTPAKKKPAAKKPVAKKKATKKKPVKKKPAKKK